MTYNEAVSYLEEFGGLHVGVDYVKLGAMNDHGLTNWIGLTDAKTAHVDQLDADRWLIVLNFPQGVSIHV